jgi:hypothetical protein
MDNSPQIDATPPQKHSLIAALRMCFIQQSKRPLGDWLQKESTGITEGWQMFSILLLITALFVGGACYRWGANGKKALKEERDAFKRDFETSKSQLIVYEGFHRLSATLPGSNRSERLEELLVIASNAVLSATNALIGVSRVEARLDSESFVPLAPELRLEFRRRMEDFKRRWPDFATNITFTVDTTDSRRKQWLLQLMDDFSTSELNIPISIGDLPKEWLDYEVQVSFTAYPGNDTRNERIWAALRDLTQATGILFNMEIPRKRFDGSKPSFCLKFTGSPLFRTNGVVFFRN